MNNDKFPTDTQGCERCIILMFSLFSRFRGPPVVYINLIRDPVNRSVSHFYFRRYGDGIKAHGRAKNPAATNEVRQTC